MFTEPSNIAQKSGWIEVVCGSMFSGQNGGTDQAAKKSKDCTPASGYFQTAA